MMVMDVNDQLPKTSLAYVLQALVPYSKANLKLSFKPKQFFSDLEKISNTRRRSLQSAYYRAQKAGLIELDAQKIPRLTATGQLKAKRYQAKHLNNNARLLVIFDIPEEEGWKRQRLRRLLRELKFKPIQKSVWESETDHRDILLAEVKQYDLQNHLRLYEAVDLNLNVQG